MTKIVFENWVEGMEKISFTKLQVEMLGLSLKEAKSNTDAILAAQSVVWDISDDASARNFLIAARALGVNCQFQEIDRGEQDVPILES